MVYLCKDDFLSPLVFKRLLSWTYRGFSLESKDLLRRLLFLENSLWFSLSALVIVLSCCWHIDRNDFWWLDVFISIYIFLGLPWWLSGKEPICQCRKVKSESEVSQSCPTLSDPMDCSPPGSSFHGIFRARVLEWGAIAFSLRALPFFKFLNISMRYYY